MSKFKAKCLSNKITIYDEESNEIVFEDDNLNLVVECEMNADQVAQLVNTAAAQDHFYNNNLETPDELTEKISPEGK